MSGFYGTLLLDATKQFSRLIRLTVNTSSDHIPRRPFRLHERCHALCHEKSNPQMLRCQNCHADFQYVMHVSCMRNPGSLRTPAVVPTFRFGRTTASTVAIAVFENMCPLFGHFCPLFDHFFAHFFFARFARVLQSPLSIFSLASLAFSNIYFFRSLRSRTAESFINFFARFARVQQHQFFRSLRSRSASIHYQYFARVQQEHYVVQNSILTFAHFLTTFWPLFAHFLATFAHFLPTFAHFCGQNP